MLSFPAAPADLHLASACDGRLSRLFHRQTGVALVAFRSRQRVQRFLRLYGPGRAVSVSEAALDAGFGSYPQFYRVFKDQMGCSPTEHRQQMRGEGEE